MIRFLMLTMCRADLRRFTTPFSCMRDFSSLVCACTGKNADLARLQILRDHERQIRQRTGGHILQHPRVVGQPTSSSSRTRAAAIIQAHFIRDDRDFFRRLHAAGTPRTEFRAPGVNSGSKAI